MTNTGTIYVFENADSENTRKFVLKAVSHTMKKDRAKTVEEKHLVTLRREIPMTRGSRYGNALLNLGNQKGGKLQAFAVGAPFEEDGKGAIYIYSGISNFRKHSDLSLAGIQSQINKQSLINPLL